MEFEKFQKILGNNYEIFNVFDDGGFGKVLLAGKKDINKLVAVKFLKDEKINESVDNIKSFNKEIRIFYKLSQKENMYIPKLYDYILGKLNEKENENEIDFEIKEIKESTNNPYYTIDFATNSSLYYYIFQIYKNKYKFKEGHSKILFENILKGIQHLHNNNICHLDIKRENIILDKNFFPLITDFGASEVINKINNGEFYSGGGSQYYRAPEVYTADENNKYNGIKADIFSLGAVLFNLVTGHYGFFCSKSESKYDYYDLYDYIRHNEYELYWKSLKENFPSIPPVTDEFKQLYFKMVDSDPKKRPSIEKILEDDKWFEEIRKKEKYIQLEQEMKDIFSDVLENKIRNEKKVFNGINIAIQQGYGSRGGLKKEEIYFNSDIKPRKLNNIKNKYNHFIKINSLANPAKFMNYLTNEITKFGKIEESDINLRFEAIFEIKSKDENEESRECKMLIELFEYDKNKYILDFIRKEGSIPDYYEYFLKIKKLLE